MSLFDTQYPFISAYLKGEEARMVTSDLLGRVLKVSGVQDVLGTIRNTDVGDYLEGETIGSFDDADRSLWKYLGRCVDQLEWFRLTPNEVIRILKAYILKYDVLNVKAALAGIATGKKASMIPVGIMHQHGLLERLSLAETVDDVAGSLTACNLDNYAATVDKYRMDGGVKAELLTGTALDGEYYRDLLEVTRGTQDKDILLKAYGIVIDIINLQMVLRTVLTGAGPEAGGYALEGGYIISREVARELVSLKPGEIPARAGHLYRDMAEEVVGSYGRTRSITDVDEIVDKYRFRLIREILSPRVLSPVVVVWYLILKEAEIRNLRLILKAAFDNVPLDGIGRYLVFP